MAKGKKGGGGSAWTTLVLVALGVGATPLALHAAGILALSGPFALSALFPWAELVKNMVVRISSDTADSWEQWLMFLQFPIYGFAIAAIAKTRSFFIGLASVAFLHGLCLLAVVGIGYLHL
jgi:hypothetical protein